MYMMRDAYKTLKVESQEDATPAAQYRIFFRTTAEAGNRSEQV